MFAEQYQSMAYVPGLIYSTVLYMLPFIYA